MLLGARLQTMKTDFDQKSGYAGTAASMRLVTATIIEELMMNE